MSIRHFLTLDDLSATELMCIVDRAIELKALQHNKTPHESCKGQVLGMIFEKASTRTRISFEAGMVQLGGHAIFLASEHTQMGRGEPIADTARVMSSMLDAVMIRTYSQDSLEEFAEYSSVPVINALTDRFHPCQLLADIQTFIECKGGIKGAQITWLGDGNNMCHSYMKAAKLLDFKLNIAAPEGYRPDTELLAETNSHVSIFDNPEEACQNSDLVTTDVWASMGQEDESQKRMRDLKNYQANDALMACAKKEALFMHCLPAHREEEVTASVIDGKQSVVWQQAENRLHAQKALLEFLLN